MSAQLQIRRRRLSVLSGFDLEFDRLPIAKLRQSQTLHGGDMDKNILSAVVGRNEPVALLHVEPFHCSGSHLLIPHSGCRVCATLHESRRISISLRALAEGVSASRALPAPTGGAFLFRQSSNMIRCKGDARSPWLIALLGLVHADGDGLCAGFDLGALG
jgi:hypothetical protein